ncbi:hypothetical protein KAR91_82745 [Candidatus Pacearchaeota archaeon]|nr:hypothetical protein [Candidatus Pacearchaeota archaeon]
MLHKFIVHLLGCLLCSLTILCSSVFALQESHFSWLPNQETNLAGYKIYYGTVSAQYNQVVDVGNPDVINGVVQATVSGLADSTTYYFVATAYDSDGFESDYSQEVVWSPNFIDADSDGDGTPDLLDGCPNDANKNEAGICGCGVADIDSDNDSILDCNDGCPLDPYKFDPGTLGCGTIDSVIIPIGTNVIVDPIPELTLVIDEVTTECALSLTVVPESFNSSVYLPLDNKMYDISLDCPDGPVTGNICLIYDEITVETNEGDVRLLRIDREGVKDITFSLDSTIDMVCGQTNTFTRFATAEPKNSEGRNPDTVVVAEGLDVWITAVDNYSYLNIPTVDSGGCTLTTFVMENPVPPKDTRQDPPVEHRLLGNEALDISIDCAPDGIVCFDYDESQVFGSENDLVLWHRSTYGWEDITESLDTVNNVICGYVTSFSPFGVGEPIDYTGQHITPYPSALSSSDSDRVVTFDASRSSCWVESFDHLGIMFPVDLECSFTWDFGGSGNVVGGNGNGLIVYQYDAPGTYTATLTTTVETSGLSLSDTVTAYAIEIQPPPPTGDFVTSINGNTVTLTAIGLDASIMRAYIYWGDRKRTVAYAPQTDFAAGLEYTYNRGGTSYNIRIMTLDSDHNEFNYTFNVDGDLTVNVP